MSRVLAVTSKWGLVPLQGRAGHWRPGYGNAVNPFLGQPLHSFPIRFLGLESRYQNGGNLPFAEHPHRELQSLQPLFPGHGGILARDESRPHFFVPDFHAEGNSLPTGFLQLLDLPKIRLPRIVLSQLLWRNQHGLASGNGFHAHPLFYSPSHFHEIGHFGPFRQHSAGKLKLCTAIFFVSGYGNFGNLGG